MSSNQNHSSVRAISSVATLQRRLSGCRGSDDYVAVIREIVATRDPGLSAESRVWARMCVAAVVNEADAEDGAA